MFQKFKKFFTDQRLKRPFFEIRLGKNRKKILKVVKIRENHGKMVEIFQRIFQRFGVEKFSEFFQKVENFPEIHKKIQIFLEIIAKFEEN